ncbi:WGR domain-containing protein [Leptospira santarosai]|uniref:WGR domain-containing protein n=1 Tax=Leptospira santarosai TaxID=28183 RepID=UPI0031FBBA10
MKKYLTFKDDKSDKFWNIEVGGNSFTVTYGKTGTVGQTQTKSFDDEEKCLKEAEKLLSEKLKKGYVEGEAQSSKEPPANGRAKEEIETRTEELKKLVSQSPELIPFLEQLSALPWDQYETQLFHNCIEAFQYAKEEMEDEDEELTGFVAECSNDGFREYGIGCSEFYFGIGEDDESFEAGPTVGGFNLHEPGKIMADAYDMLGGQNKTFHLLNNYIWNLVARTMGRAASLAVKDKSFKRLKTVKNFKVYVCEHDGWACSMDSEGLVFENNKTASKEIPDEQWDELSEEWKASFQKPIYAQRCWKLDALYFDNRPPKLWKNLTGLNRCIKVKRLQIENVSSLETLDGIQGMTQLEKLELNGNINLTDISALKTLKNLKELKIIGSKNLTDSNTFIHLKNLQLLTINDTTFDSWDFISALVSLKELSISNSNINDLSPLSNLKSIRHLWLARNPYIKDLKPLSDLSLLETIRLSGDKEISFFLPLAKLSKLELLVCFENPMSEENILKLKEALPNCKDLSIQPPN